MPHSPLAGLALTGCSSTTSSAPAETSTAPTFITEPPVKKGQEVPLPTTPPTPPPTQASPPPVGSVSQQQAVRKAQSYLDTMPFSKPGLIKQLQFEKFSAEDATYAVEHVSVDWKEQAALKAESYLQSQAFSREGLLKQLAFEGFTPEEAEYGVGSVGL